MERRGDRKISLKKEYVYIYKVEWKISWKRLLARGKSHARFVTVI